ncbi:hypothetical protein D3C75_1125720 [compost metagenome]
MHSSATAFEPLRHSDTAGRLHQKADKEASDHDRSHNPGNTTGFQFETVALQNNADDWAEYNQGEQPCEYCINQTFFDYVWFIFSDRHSYTFATSGRPSRP